MATSSFAKSYKVPKETAGEFVKEMSQKGESVLNKNFHSSLTHLEYDGKFREQIHKALENTPAGNKDDPGKP